MYIGKAVSLRNRVRSYFQDSAAHPLRTTRMVERVIDVRSIVVNNEIEALILEANLIKRHQPPFNVRLRDDKRYPYLKVTNEPFPRVTFTRVVRDDGARYFGPYTNAHGLRELINLVRVVFPLRTCREPIDGKRKRPCLQYHIKRCLAPCVGYQSEAEYDALVDEVVLFLGRPARAACSSGCTPRWTASAERLNYEAAARVRDRIVAVRRVTEGQKVVWRSRIDMDLIAVRARARPSVHASVSRARRQADRAGTLHPRRRHRSERRRTLLAVFHAVLHGARRRRARRRASATAFRRWRLREARDNEVPVALKARARRVGIAGRDSERSARRSVAARPRP